MRLMSVSRSMAASTFLATLLLTTQACSQISGQAPPTSSSQIPQGQRVAQRACGGCHAVAEGASPLADAPPFRNLHRRYPAGGLPQLLAEGMLPADRPQEEGSRPGHPRMPEAQLDLDEVAALTAYLRSLEPRT